VQLRRFDSSTDSAPNAATVKRSGRKASEDEVLRHPGPLPEVSFTRKRRELPQRVRRTLPGIRGDFDVQQATHA